jgi:hypothetical protein
MAPDVARVLDGLSRRDRFRRRDDFVFVSEDGGPLDGSALRRRYVEAQTAAALRKLRFHDLRHSFGTIAANAALSGQQLQAWMGHADYLTTQRYLHYRERGDEAGRVEVAFATDVVEELQIRRRRTRDGRGLIRTCPESWGRGPARDSLGSRSRSAPKTLSRGPCVTGSYRT